MTLQNIKLSPQEIVLMTLRNQAVPTRTVLILPLYSRAPLTQTLFTKTLITQSDTCVPLALCMFKAPDNTKSW